MQLNYDSFFIIGHGPFSHLWEKFVKTSNPGLDWEHEHSSIKMLDNLIEANNLGPVLKELGDLDEQDILFIKECIAGPIDTDTGLPVKHFMPDSTKDWLYRGRGECFYDLSVKNGLKASDFPPK